MEVDSTVPPIKGGIEIISPPFPIPEALEHAEEMIDFIRVDGSTDNRCGLHVHMSIEGVKL
ncbi:MAG: amidoligase family protein [Candidatus Woesearchaeota archaeon]